MPPPIHLELPEHVALVMLEWLYSLEHKGEQVFNHPADQRAAWILEGLLENQLVAPFMPDYLRILQDAREKLLQQ